MKICISGPAVSGKTYFLDRISDSQDVTVLSESARKVAEIYPDMPANNIGKFREKICEFQRQRETVVESLMDDGIILCDRGIFDNLAFLLLQDKERFHREFTTVLYAYKNKIIKPYDYIVYFDIDLLDGITPLLKEALDDPLRKATINVDNYARHVADFRIAFIEVTSYFKGVNVVPITAKPDEKRLEERNELVKDYILNSKIQNNWKSKNRNFAI